MAPKVLIMGKVYWANQYLEQELAPLAEILYLESNSRDELFKDFSPGSKYQDIVAIYHEHLSQPTVGSPDAEMINALPSSVKWIAHKGAGYDQFDTSACKARGISLSNTPGAVDEATATTALYLLIATVRNFSICEAALRNHQFTPDPYVERMSHDLGNLTIGILGMGSIGVRFAEMLTPFNMNVIYHNQKPSALAPPNVKYFSDMNEMLKVIDVLSVHIPLSASTINFIGEKEIRTMKRGSIIINTARGKIIDEEALIHALEDGHLASAGLDVFASEPAPDSRLLKIPNTTLLPHVGTENQDTRRKMEVKALANIKDFLIGRRGENCVKETK